MTGPEHYSEGERLLAGQPVNTDDRTERGVTETHWPPTAREVAEANAHFLAALVAVQAEDKFTDRVSWQKAVGW
ncbi:hypothetical protein ACIRQH_35075 [Streptomyces sp. NPDC102279]|uniref:hypothetical protein n=1 Tax=Streptomyces sp. NPDC102279 TaxID=3366153 RepID=UPI00382C60CD